MFSINLVLCVILLTGHISAVVFQDCGSAYELTSVDIEGCELMPPCFVTLGETVPVSIEFFADFMSRKLDQDVLININYVNLRPEVTPEQCETVVCPVVPNTISSLTSKMSVPQNMALNQRGYLQWRVYNESGQRVLCYSVLVQTQSPLQKLLRRFGLLRRKRHA
ncbi:uncharacterized protein LOC135080589 [Ostrinia nubilalis]|uniref:uncharacterized protein LOC135080589 n=2 Tax=Ostrinia TaxID=29056 RepID=UPI0030824F40